MTASTAGSLLQTVGDIATFDCAQTGHEARKPRAGPEALEEDRALEYPWAMSGLEARASRLELVSGKTPRLTLGAAIRTPLVSQENVTLARLPGDTFALVPGAAGTKTDTS